MQPTGVGAVQSVACPLCGARVLPDGWGLVECPCGWGGPGDPLESARGPSRLVTRTDRRLANAAARRELARLGRPNWRPGDLGFLYTCALLLAATVIYLAVGVLLVGSVALAVYLALDQAWFGMAIMALIALAVGASLIVGRPKLSSGIAAPRDRFPRLWSALDDVHRRTGAPLPNRVALLPIANAFVFQHRPLRRLFRREVVLGLGVGTLPLMREPELRALLTHELAHFGHGHTALHRYFLGAELSLQRIVETALGLVGVHTAQRRRYGYRRGTGTAYVALGAIVVTIIMLPVRVLWIVYHLLRLAESRAAEFEADRAAIRTYGTRTFADMQTSAAVARRTLTRTLPSLREDMLKHNSQNVFEEMRRYYAALPPEVIAKLRLDGLREFRTLENDHPTLPGRLRAAAIANFAAPADVPLRPAVEVIIPAGAHDAAEVERQLTTALFEPKKGKRGRR